MKAAQAWLQEVSDETLRAAQGWIGDDPLTAPSQADDKEQVTTSIGRWRSAEGDMGELGWRAPKRGEPSC